MSPLGWITIFWCCVCAACLLVIGGKALSNLIVDPVHGSPRKNFWSTP